MTEQAISREPDVDASKDRAESPPKKTPAPVTSSSATAAVTHERADIIIVGARIAGCALAIRMADAGKSVILLDRGERETDVLSTHYLQDLRLWDELDILNELHALGAPPLHATRTVMDGVDMSVRHPQWPRMCVRRILLDEMLRKRVERAQVNVRTGMSVTRLLTENNGRVRGVVAVDPDGNQHHISAPLVVGADGRNSTIARLVGAAKYAVTTNDRDAIWRYYANLPVPHEFQLVRDGRQIYFMVPCDSGMTLVVAQPPRDDPRDYRDKKVFEENAQRIIPTLQGLFDRAQQVGEVCAVRRMDGFFREAAGEGWVLVGDSGHFKDVITGQGISDALRQVRSLSAHLTPAYGSPRTIDAATARWWGHRDADARPMYFFSRSIGLGLPTNSIDVELFRYISRSERRRRNLTLMLRHEYNPRRLMGLPAAVSFARAVCRPGNSFSTVLADAQASMYRQFGRKQAR
ncbi:FAD-dependent monooxygenase [Mycobacterium sp. 134]|uniref:NAD(P)/FAD-dependent oxidoreductase n=1 Tax=unclassified Mycobacterium TaxID=2642494 RepID=UPI0009EF0186|nr:NAD(P)/FAD-dependent oxidoreductase [Mycobacterium sp. E802]